MQTEIQIIKRSGSGILFLIIFLFIVLIAMLGMYWYFWKTDETSTKQLFFNHLSNSNIKEVILENGYETLSEKLLNSNYESNSTMNFITNVENEKLEGLDISKFTFDLKNQNNVDYSKTYRELGIDYSGNEILRIKLITNEDCIGIAEDDIVNKYVGVHYDSLKDKYGIELNKNKINTLLKTEKIDLTDEEKLNFVSKNISKIAELIPEEKFTIQDNIIINQNDNSIPVTGYTLTLSQEELNNIFVELLKNIRNDEEFLNKLIYKNAARPTINVKAKKPNSLINENQEDVPENFDEQNNNIEGELENQNLEGQVEFDSQQTSNLETVSGETNEFNEPQFVDEELEQENNEDEYNSENEELQEDENVGEQELELIHTTNLTPVGEENSAEIDFQVLNEISDYSEVLKLLLGLKTNKTLKELQDAIDTWIIEADKLSGNGLTMTVYASSEKTEKISITLPKENTIDIEILKKNDSENRLKLTYLYKGNNSLFKIPVENAEEITEDFVEQELIENQTNGISFDIYKIETTTNTSLDVTINLIENEKINKKVSIKSDMEGALTSSSMRNNLIITISTKENESKFIAETNFKFLQSGIEIEDLIDNNCLFLDTLSDEDYELTIQAIKDKIDFVWAEKKEHFNLIDTNTRGLSSIRKSLDSVSNNITRNSARKILEEKITNMRNEAGENEQEFTVQNLENLSIEGYEVSSVVTENNAVIVIDIYTFNVDSEFNITNK